MSAQQLPTGTPGLLRPYQQAAVDGVLSYWRAKRRNPLVEIPTGGGKSRVLGAIAAEAVRRKGRVLVATHRQELIQQDADACRIMAPCVDVGIYSAGIGKREVCSITVAGVQSIAGRHHELGTIDLVIVDEAHMVSTTSTTLYRKLIDGLRERRPGMQVLGLTATPYRQGQGLLTQGDDRMFDAVAYRVTVRELLAHGYLAPLATVETHGAIDTSGVPTRAGEFVANDLELAANIDEVNDAVAVDVAAALAKGRRSALLFGVSVAHAGALCTAMRAAGVDCAVVTGETPADERAKILADFKAQRLPAIASMGVLTTGFDAPVVDVLALVRPTQSTSLYVQMAGRGMRTSPGKVDCLFLDYGGNIARHGPVDDVLVREKRTRIAGEGECPKRTCPACLFEQPAGCLVCQGCGHAFPVAEKKANKQASKLNALSGERTRHTGVEVRFALHRKRGAEEAQPYLRVDYLSAAGRIASEFIGFGHGDWKEQKASTWWTRRVGGEVPATSAEAYDHVRKSGARPVGWIETTMKNGYETVVGVELAE